MAPAARAVVIDSATKEAAPRAEFAVPPRSRVPTSTGAHVGVDTAASSGLRPRAHALFDLAVLGRSRTEARDRLATAVAGYTAGYARSRAIAQTKLASLTMVAGDPVEAATIGTEAVTAAGTLRSRRAADDLRELARYANVHADVGEVVELRQRIRTAVLAS